MRDFGLDDTIIAVSTPPGEGGIGILRLSGGNALDVARRIFRAKKKSGRMTAQLAVFGNLFDFESGEALDDAYLLYFPGPHSYTRENVVEISCHGSPAVLEEGLKLGVRAGARLARPGEFTLRAYLHGRIDIIQAEGVNDLIRAGSAKSAKMAFRLLEGRLSRKIEWLREQIIEVLSDIEALIEFPDEPLPLDKMNVGAALGQLIDFVERLVSGYDVGKALSDGVSLGIVGRANVGKSTLFNAILEDERAIVTPYPGTTRDYLKERIQIKDAHFNLVDMAGIGRPSSKIERESMRRGRKIAAEADGRLLVLDTSKKEDPEDIALLGEFQRKKSLLVFNKIDLPRKMDVARVKERFPRLTATEISALKGTYLEDLRENIYKVFAPQLADREDVIFHLRQKVLFDEMLVNLKNGLALLLGGHSEEVFAEEIRKIIPIIGQLTGEIRTEEVIDNIFGRFCIGK